MKKILLFTLSLFITLVSYSQGIEFEHGTWAEVLEKAKSTNKPIFIDVYTSWCGPCKAMSKEVFPLAEVGKEYNTNFICYSIDAEKGEGVTIANLYEVNSYPTYLFLKADKSLIMKSGSRMAVDKFIALSQAAKQELKSTKPISEWDKEYVDKKKDTAFLLGYIQKRSKLGMKNTELFDEYLALLPNDQRGSNGIIEIYQQERSNLKINSIAYKNLQTNAFIIFPKLGGFTYMIISAAIENSFREAIKTKNELLLQQVVEANENQPKTTESKPKELYYMNYYKATDELEKYIIHATKYCESSLMMVSPDSIAQQDKKSLQTFEQTKSIYTSMIKDSAQLAELKSYMEHAQRNKYSSGLNNVAWGFFEKVSDEKALENALRWSKRSLEIYRNCYHLDTYANLLYKLGRKEEAIIKETEALDFATKYKYGTKTYEEVLKKMNSGEKTWK